MVSGSMDVRALPGPPLELVRERISLSGMTGPCVVVVECSSGPGFYRYLGPWEGEMRAAHLN
jgi:hypothetical protein